MIIVQGYDCPYRECLFVALPDSSLPPELEDKLFNQSVRHLGAKFSIAIILTIASPVPKYTEDNLQQIFQTISEARAPTNSKELTKFFLPRPS